MNRRPPFPRWRLTKLTTSMDRKIANIILKVFAAVWILVSAVALVIILAMDSPLKENLQYFCQLLISLFCSLWLGVYIWKDRKTSSSEGTGQDKQ